MFRAWYPAWSPAYAAVVRANWHDLLASAFLFVTVSFAAGRVWRFPFDDEVYTLDKLERFSALEIAVFYLTGSDVHPPLSYLALDGLHALGLTEAGMRLCSLAMTGLALVIFHALTLAWIAQRRGAPVASLSRLVALLMFGLCALAISQGDVLRWYPLFALEIALAVALYVAGGNGAARLWSAAILGIAASTNFLAAFVLAPLALYRYGLQRHLSVRFDAGFWLLVLIFGSLGICTALYLFFGNIRMAGTQIIGGGVVQAALTNALGFFGGHALGLGQAWITVPAIAIAAAAAWGAIDRERPDDPVHLLLLILVAALALPLAGFAKPRSFLYLAPMLAALLTLFLDRQAARRPGLALLLAALLTATAVAAIANIRDNPHPFKRNTVIPYGTVVDFIRDNMQGRVLVLSTDPVLPWLLRHQAGGSEACVSYFSARAGCIEQGGRFDTVFVVHGHSDKFRYPQVIARFEETVAAVTAGRSWQARLHAGVDEDAELKTRLTGVALGRNILTIDLYR